MKALALAALFVLALAAPAAAQNTPETMQCGVVRGMQWLDNLSHGLNAEQRTLLDDRERVACGMGMEAQANEYWPSGGVFRAGDNWYYPNGGVYFSSGYYYSNGGIFGTMAGQYYYPNGGVILSEGTWYGTSGGVSSETGLVAEALPRLSRERGDELLGDYRRETASLWRMIYFASLVWEGR